MNIAIAGTGYVGLVTAVCLADKGHKVFCVDTNHAKIELLKNGVSPIFEDGLEELLTSNKKNLIFTQDYSFAYKNSDVIFIGVGTPENTDGSANLQYVYKVAEQISTSILNDCLIVVKSTVPIGTNDKIELYLKDNIKKDINVMVASNPEFLSQGTAVHDTLHAERIVFGIECEAAKKILENVYKDFDVPKLFMNRRSAEMVKYASNDFLALKISYINEIANLCEDIYADIFDVVRGMGLDSRIGKKFLNAGIGYGGSCFPKDTKALHWLSNMHDKELKTIKAAIEVNEQQKIKLVKKSKKYYKNLKNKTVAILGLSFKPGTDDLREAPSLANISLLLEAQARLKAWDPVASESVKAIYPNEIEYCQTIDSTIQGADICFIFTEWDEIKNYNISNYSKLMNIPIVLDGRNCYNLKDFNEEIMVYESIGRNIYSNLEGRKYET